MKVKPAAFAALMCLVAATGCKKAEPPCSVLDIAPSAHAEADRKVQQEDFRFKTAFAVDEHLVRATLEADLLPAPPANLPALHPRLAATGHKTAMLVAQRDVDGTCQGHTQYSFARQPGGYWIMDWTDLTQLSVRAMVDAQGADIRNHIMSIVNSERRVLPKPFCDSQDMDYFAGMFREILRKPALTNAYAGWVKPHITAMVVRADHRANAWQMLKAAFDGAQAMLIVDNRRECARVAQNFGDAYCHLFYAGVAQETVVINMSWLAQFMAEFGFPEATDAAIATLDALSTRTYTVHDLYQHELALTQIRDGEYKPARTADPVIDPRILPE